MNTVIELVKEALAEDARERSVFDPIRFEQFFPEETRDAPDAVRAAWVIYAAIRYRGKTLADFER